MGKVIDRIRSRQERITEAYLQEYKQQDEYAMKQAARFNPLLAATLNARVSESLPVIEKKFGRPSVFRWFSGDKKVQILDHSGEFKEVC